MERVKPLKLNFDPSTLFRMDETGMLLTDPTLVPWDDVFDRIELMYSVDSVRENAIRTAKGVELEANIPAGNTAVIDGGYKLHGPQPYRLWKGEKSKGFMHSPTAKERRLLKKRENSCYQYYGKLKEATEAYEPTIKNAEERVAYLINRHQIKTGFGFDNCNFGDVTKAAMKTVIDSITSWKSFDVRKSSKYVFKALEDVKKSLIQQGMKLGSLRVYPATIMRAMASKDGLIPFFLYKHGFDPYTNEMDVLLLKATRGAFSAKKHIGSEYSLSFLKDDGNRVEWKGKYPLIAALSDLVQECVFTIADLIPVITTLERVQKSGVKDGTPTDGSPDFGVIRKDGKARSVSPTEVLQGVIESMVCVAFNEECRRLGINFFPSIQNPETRHKMYEDISVWISSNSDYRLSDIDLTAFDKHFNGSLLATMLHYVVRPFFNANDWGWFDAMNIIANYKVMWMYAPYVEMHAELLKEIEELGVPFRKIGDFYAFALWSGLMSGMKGTHITFGSMYNLCFVQRGPMLIYSERHSLDYESIEFRGFAGGDDVLAVVHKSLMSKDGPESMQELFDIMMEYFGQEVNPGKLIWEWIQLDDGTWVKILTYLQENIVPELHIYGQSSEGRSAAGYFIKERPTHMSAGDQARAVIARAQNGWNDPMCKVYLRILLENSDLIRYCFSKYGAKAYQFLTEHSQMSFEKWCEVVGIDDYYWGASLEDVKEGKLQIIPLLAEVAKEMGDSGENLESSDSVRLFLRDMEKAQTTTEPEDARSDIDLDDFE